MTFVVAFACELNFPFRILGATGRSISRYKSEPVRSLLYGR